MSASLCCLSADLRIVCHTLRYTVICACCIHFALISVKIKETELIAGVVKEKKKKIKTNKHRKGLKERFYLSDTHIFN